MASLFDIGRFYAEWKERSDARDYNEKLDRFNARDQLLRLRNFIAAAQEDQHINLLTAGIQDEQQAALVRYRDLNGTSVDLMFSEAQFLATATRDEANQAYDMSMREINLSKSRVQADVENIHFAELTLDSEIRVAQNQRVALEATTGRRMDTLRQRETQLRVRERGLLATTAARRKQIKVQENEINVQRGNLSATTESRVSVIEAETDALVAQREASHEAFKIRGSRIREQAARDIGSARVSEAARGITGTAANQVKRIEQERERDLAILESDEKAKDAAFDAGMVGQDAAALRTRFAYEQGILQADKLEAGLAAERANLESTFDAARTAIATERAGVAEARTGLETALDTGRARSMLQFDQFAGRRADLAARGGIATQQLSNLDALAAYAPMERQRAINRGEFQSLYRNIEAAQRQIRTTELGTQARAKGIEAIRTRTTVDQTNRDIDVAVFSLLSLPDISPISKEDVDSIMEQLGIDVPGAA